MLHNVDKNKVIKGCVVIFVGYGVSKIVTSIINENTNPNTNLEKVGVLVGSYVITGLVVDQAKHYASSGFDRAIAWYNINVKSST